MQGSEGVGPLPLAGVKVLDFSQFLAGPVCALRLQDLGAEVIKIERAGQGDLCRSLVVADQTVGPDSLLFHTINRGKRSVAVDLKSPADLATVRRLIASADVMIHNFRPGVMERIGLGYEAVEALNPRIVYGCVSGYGPDGVWRDQPGQDLLAQSRSGLVWLNGSAGDGPVPVGVSITDIAAGMHLAQGVLAALFKQARTNRGSLVEVSLLASAMDLQFEQFTAYLNGKRAQPARAAVGGANVYASAPYGLYKTSDGHLAIAMTPIAALVDCLELDALRAYADPSRSFVDRERINAILREAVATRPTTHWLSRLAPRGIWCAEVLDWPQLERMGVLDELGVIQTVETADGVQLKTTTCPIRIDGQVLRGSRAAAALGADNAAILDASRTPTKEAAP